MDPLSSDDGEDRFEEDDSDSEEYSPGIDGEVGNEVTDISIKCVHRCRKYKHFAEPTASSKKYVNITWTQGDNTGMTAWGEMC